MNLWRKVHYLIHRRQLEQELTEELEAHRVEMGDRGASFGSALKLREESNDAWGFGWLDRLRQDLHYGARILRKSPGFTLTAVAILALGIGMNVTAFGFFNTMVLRPMAVKDPGQIVRLLRAAPGSMADNSSYPSFDFYRRHNRVFSAMWALASSELLLDSGEKVDAHFVSPEFFREMGGAPALGGFPEGPGSVVLSDLFWKKQFGGDPSVVGQKIRLNQSTAVVVGVLSPRYVCVEPDAEGVWLPLADHGLYIPGSQLFTDTEMMPLRVYGRLLPGISRKAAEDGLRQIVDEYRKLEPKAVWKDEYAMLQSGAYAVLLNPQQNGFLAVPGLLLLLVLAAACANLGNLMLARGATRIREISIRAAAGASRGRIVRQLLTESLMLALLGAAAGVPLSYLATRLFVHFSGAPDIFDFTPDWRVGLFALAMALIAALFFGLGPALQLSRAEPRTASRTRMLLIAAQVATSCTLVILSGLMTRGMQSAVTTNPGFVYEQSAYIQMDLSTSGIRGVKARLFLDDLRTRMGQIPGVLSTGLSILPPLGNMIAAMPNPAGEITMHTVDAKYFETMGIPIRQGRSFEPNEREINVILGERLAQRHWAGASPIGKEFPSADGKTHWTVIGVAANAPTVRFGNNDAMELYQPLTDATFEFATVVVRTNNIHAALPMLQKAANADRRVTGRVTAMRERYENNVRNGRLAATAISCLGLVALTVAMVGLAGLISYTVAQRTKEIGIRMVLGARPVEALRVGFRQLLIPVGAGMAAGIAATMALAQALRFTLYGISPVDPIAYVGALVLFTVLVVAAAAGPLRRAANVDPAAALRHD